MLVMLALPSVLLTNKVEEEAELYIANTDGMTRVVATLIPIINMNKVKMNSLMISRSFRSVGINRSKDIVYHHIHLLK